MATQTFQVEGMSCGHCELSIQEEVGEIPGVTSVKADHTTGKVVVEGAEVSREDVDKAVEEAGFKLL
ncbi:heavy-metal-associated domain-containing protein [Corynebacterium sp. NML140438]|uniref:heavy-metal-associated domain-containing protein n=1 Tax=Corynebacterium sp. NML140438 TaxID=1906334 RepID=UPI0008FBBA16|nr:cation transporter [Corynebacterium sp. NML140438]OIR43140.1 transporter [Corynebacterium sp. NML140438]